ncbi:MAG: hypothetical protein IJH84_20240 [Saccharopolyspora sp.]|uniref:hypothetical protein n=1 Tax=Saccharopolyspora TaxID=1835 RepID=UPI00190AA833|nr:MULTISPECIES: hypothetical protein [unclassified Saccharopolyspora]MBK0865388.1 hypothetical protein [Saccharopolyspora sp. HNM0986]MBQ6643347.1 hypothetical protein [Saccharopolyspora sp.]
MPEREVPEELPRVLADVGELAADESSGVRWKLAEAGRQLDANVVRLAPHQRVDAHAEPDLDVLLLVLGGNGVLEAADGSHPMTGGALLWLPHGSRRAFTAGEAGLTYLTTHRRRPGMWIGSAP